MQSDLSPQAGRGLQRVGCATEDNIQKMCASLSSSGELTNRPFGPRRAVVNQNIENNPMQSSLAVAGMGDPAKTI
jgi:hypothetical protein